MLNIILLSITVLLLATTGARGDSSLCFEEAGAEYSINPKILRAIAKVESNYNPRAINWNKNGTYDFGVMQINTIWAPLLGKERWNALGDPCTNIKTGASILSGCMKKYGYTWEAIGCYNSQTPDKRDRYARMVFKQLQRIEKDDTNLKKNLEAVVRDRVEEWVAATENGRREFTAKVPAAASNGAVEAPALAAGEKPPLPEDRAIELSASSLFQEAGKGL